MELIFIYWAIKLEGGLMIVNDLSVCILFLLIFDVATGTLAAFETYYIQEQFIPLHLIQLDDILKDAEGVFGEVQHGRYMGTDIAVKRAKPESKNQRKEMYKAFLNEAEILQFVYLSFLFLFNLISFSLLFYFY